MSDVPSSITLIGSASIAASEWLNKQIPPAFFIYLFIGLCISNNVAILSLDMHACGVALFLRSSCAMSPICSLLYCLCIANVFPSGQSS